MEAPGKPGNALSASAFEKEKKKNEGINWMG